MSTDGNVKPFLCYTEQIALLKRRGLIVSNDILAMQVLKRLNYYRLSAYSLTLRKDDIFYENVSFEDIVALYDFDAAFRQVILKYTHFVEISARSYIAYYHTQKYGPLGYLDAAHFIFADAHAGFIEKLNHKIDSASDTFVVHHKSKRAGVFPLWVAIEETDFGMLSRFFKIMQPSDKGEITKTYYNIPYIYVETYLQCASVARNIAAHGGRFYNRIKLGPSAKLPKKLTNVKNDTPFAYVCAIYALLPDIHKAAFVGELVKTFKKHPFAQSFRLGFPTTWEDCLYTL